MIASGTKIGVHFMGFNTWMSGESMLGERKDRVRQQLFLVLSHTDRAPYCTQTRSTPSNKEQQEKKRVAKNKRSGPEICTHVRTYHRHVYSSENKEHKRSVYHGYMLRRAYCGRSFSFFTQYCTCRARLRVSRTLPVRWCRAERKADRSPGRPVTPRGEKLIQAYRTTVVHARLLFDPQ